MHQHVESKNMECHRNHLGASAVFTICKPQDVHDAEMVQFVDDTNMLITDNNSERLQQKTDRVLTDQK
jgi:hypothetical protein